MKPAGQPSPGFPGLPGHFGSPGAAVPEGHGRFLRGSGLSCILGHYGREERQSASPTQGTALGTWVQEVEAKSREERTRREKAGEAGKKPIRES